MVGFKRAAQHYKTFRRWSIIMLHGLSPAAFTKSWIGKSPSL